MANSFGFNLATLLATDTDVHDSAASRIYPAPLPPGAVGDVFLPTITYQEVGAKDLDNIAGYSGLVRTLFQLNCWGKQHEDADLLRRRVKAFLRFYKGAAGDGTIKGSNNAGDREFYDGERRLYQKITSFNIWWESE